MRRTGWKTVTGLGIAGLLVAMPAARADDTHKGMGSGQSSDTSSSSGMQSSGTSGSSDQSATTADKHLSGKVDKYDRENRTLSLANSDKRLKITDDTQVTKDGDRVSPGQIMEGDDVRASYSDSGAGDVVEVLVIEVTPGSEPASGAAPGSTGTSSGASGSSTGTK